jgi:hypothetical protein
LFLRLAILLGVALLAPKAFGQEGEPAPTYPVASASEERQIKSLLALLPMPVGLSRKKAEIEARRKEEAVEKDKAAPPPEGADPAVILKAKKAGLKKKIEESVSRIKKLTPQAYKRFRTTLDKELAKFDAKDEVKKLEYELQALKRFIRNLFSTEAPSVRGLTDAEVNKLRVVREKELSERAQEIDTYRKSLSAYYKARKRAVKELLPFGSKAVPCIVKRFEKAGFDEGASLVEVLFPVKKDPRFHKALLIWFDRQNFQEILQVPAVLRKVADMRLPDPVPHFERALYRTSFIHRGTFLASFYRLALARPKDSQPAVRALLDFLPKADSANLVSALNIINLFLGNPKTSNRVRIEVIKTYANLARSSAPVTLVRNLAYGLGASRIPEAVPSLVRLMRHKDKWVRLYALQGLGSLGPHAIEALPDVLNAMDWAENARQKQAAILTLGRIGSTEPVDKLLELLDSDNDMEKESARIALRMILKVDYSKNSARWRAYWLKKKSE